MSGKAYRIARGTIASKVFAIWIVQMSLVYLLFEETILGNLGNTSNEFGQYPPSVSIVFVRFLCGLIMHLTL